MRTSDGFHPLKQRSDIVTRRLALIWLGATAVVSAIVGVISYGVGWASGAAAHLPQGAAAVGPYWYGPHFFGFFGFLPFLFLLCCLFFVFRIGRWGRPWGGWGYPGYTPYQQPGVNPPPPPSGDPWQGWPQRPQQQPAQPPETEKPAQ
jgi:hypothetical protein